jgi:hypothetical protein
MQDKDWREYNIHGDDVQDACFDLFDSSTKDKYQTLEWNFPNIMSTISLRGNAEDYTNSTGMTVWAGSEVLCDYLVTHPSLVKEKKVLELGAGMGLCGTVAHKLGASSVCLTDGDIEVLENLRYNAEHSVSVDSNTDVTCPQLIWGHDLDTFAKTHGKHDIVIATDCAYITKCLTPMFDTVHELLDLSNGIFLFVMVASSQSSMEVILARAQACGLELCPKDSNEQGNAQVFVFRHQKRMRD